jgi:3-deoxy-manno-octulosonate cytidylyltransferase (CMP-KDO synthetase)
MSILIVIPARWASTRFPGKPLADIAGTPMIQRVYERARQAHGAPRVIVATDDPRIADAARGFGAETVITPADLRSGTERVACAIADLEGGVIVNVQGDEPLLDPAVIDAAVGALSDAAEADIGTVVAPLRDASDLADPNVVKVARAADGRALYFSRAPIPFVRDDDARTPHAGMHFRHVGIYAFRRAALLRFAALPPAPLETAEQLEQLRALEHGMRIQTRLVDTAGVAVDVPADIDRVLALLDAADVPPPPRRREG